MNKNFIIRQEKEEDYPIVEALTRRAFWNLYVPGCTEHYIAHVLRKHRDFIPELDLVLEAEGQLIGNIMYTKSTLTDENGDVKEILTFGPLSILPEFQRQGYGKALIEASFEKASKLGYDAVVIFGNPGNYVSRGFKSCKKYNVSLEGGIFPSAMLVKELTPGALDSHRWLYRDSPAYQIEPQAAEAFEQQFEPLKKEVLPSQEEFYIHCNSRIF